MNQRTSFFLARTVLALAPLVVAVAPDTSFASPTFPEAIQTHLALECAPSCTLCHRTAEGGASTAVKPFVKAMIVPGGLAAGFPETVGPALNSVETAGTDADGDGTGDIAELVANRDPNEASVAAGDDVLICPPTYGCGARISPRDPIDGSAFAFALAVAGFLGLRVRRRRS
jgi:hypothetical protein